MTDFLVFDFNSTIGQSFGGMNDMIGKVASLDGAMVLRLKSGSGNTVQAFDYETGLVFVTLLDNQTGEWSNWEISPIYHPTYSSETPVRQLWTHNKRGGIYVIETDEATLQMNEIEYDGAEVVVYRSLIDGRRWVRMWREFMDGRFTKLPSPDQPAATDDPAGTLVWQPARHWVKGVLCPDPGRFICAEVGGLFQVRPVVAETNVYSATFTRLGAHSPEMMTCRPSVASAKRICEGYAAKLRSGGKTGHVSVDLD